MAYDDDKPKGPLDGKRLLNDVEDPAQLSAGGTSSSERERQIEDAIMAQFLTRLPSNYVSQVQGPIYTNIFRGWRSVWPSFKWRPSLRRMTRGTT